MKYWIIKSEPSAFSIDEMKKNNVEPWNGVRNYQARNFMKDMNVDDTCFFYHSNTKEPGIVGLVNVVKMHYPDPDDFRFVCVDMQYMNHCPLLSLKQLKSIPELGGLPLFHQSRLSVQPVDLKSAKIILNIIEK